MSKRKAHRPGHHLPEMPAANFLEGWPYLHNLNARLVSEGFTPPKTVRPYLRRDRRVSITLVWRCRKEGLTEVHTLTWRIPVGQILDDKKTIDHPDLNGQVWEGAPL